MEVSPIDSAALENWKAYNRARTEMLARTHNLLTPWTIVRADGKRAARLNLIKDLLARLHYDGKDETALVTDPDVVFQYDGHSIESAAIAP